MCGYSLRSIARGKNSKVTCIRAKETCVHAKKDLHTCAVCAVTQYAAPRVVKFQKRHRCAKEICTHVLNVRSTQNVSQRAVEFLKSQLCSRCIE